MNSYLVKAGSCQFPSLVVYLTVALHIVGFFRIKMAVTPNRFIGQVKEELFKVTYPTRDEVIRLTIIVIIFSLAVSFFLSGLDFLFGKGVSLLLQFSGKQ